MPPQEPGHVQVTSRSRPGHVQVTSRSYHHLVLIISDGGVAAGDGCGAGGGVHPHCVLRRQRLGPLLLQIRQFRGTPPPPQYQRWNLSLSSSACVQRERFPPRARRSCRGRYVRAVPRRVYAYVQCGQCPAPSAACGSGRVDAGSKQATCSGGCTAAGYPRQSRHQARSRLRQAVACCM